MKKLWLSTLLLGILAGCSTSEIEEATQPSAPILHAEIADETNSRTYLEKAKYMRWHAEDEISAFLGNTLNQCYGFDGKTGANSGTFSQVSYQLGTGNPIPCIHAFYPYAATTTMDDETGTIGYIFPKVQQYGAGDTYGQGSNPMIASTSSTSDVFLYFRNVGGYLKLQLYGAGVTIKAISIKGNQQEKLSGTATITAAYNTDPEVTMSDEATEGVVLDCGEGVLLSEEAQNPTIFWIVLPPTTFESGFTITVKGDNGKGCSKSTSKKQIISRNSYLAMSPFAVVCDQEIDEKDFEDTAQVEQEVVVPNNQIWYTTKNGMAYDISNGGSIDPMTLFGANLLSNIYYPEGYGLLTFDGDVTTIEGAFQENALLTSIKLPNSIISIGKNAFRNCTSITEISIPNSVTKIAQAAFSGCTSLTSCNLPESITSISNSAFNNCSSLFDITIPNGVDDIGNAAFEGCKSLKSIIIPNSVTWIGWSAFMDCTSLQTLIIPESVTTICTSAFAGCSALTHITLPENLETVGTSILSRCPALSAIYGKCASSDNRCLIIDGKLMAFAASDLLNYEIPNNITSIAYGAFYDCQILTSVTIPESISSIEHGAFAGCKSLVAFYGKFASSDNRCLIVDHTLKAFAPSGITTYHVTVPITTIDMHAFANCTLLTDIILPESLQHIDMMAFAGCNALECITIPNSVTQIGSSAFESCASLKYVYCTATTPPDISYTTFENCSSNLKIYVPASGDHSIINAYQTASGWSYYKHQIEEFCGESGGGEDTGDGSESEW